MHVCKHEAIHSFLDGRTVKKHPKKHIHETAKSKLTSNKLKEKTCFIFKILFFCNKLLDQSKKRLINYFL